MKLIDIDEVQTEKILYEKSYTVLYNKNDDILKKLYAKNSLFKLSENTFLFGVVGCYHDIPINHSYNFVFSDNNIENGIDTIAIIKKVYALGTKEISEIPAKWNVTALIEFPNGIPDLIKNKEEKDILYLCPKKLWEDLVKFIP
jgi:hypothetical protein